MDACKSPLVNERGVIPEYFTVYLASSRIPGNVPSRVVVTRSRQRRRPNATLSVFVAIGGNRQPTISGQTGPLMLPIRRCRPFTAITDLDYDTTCRIYNR